MNRQAILNLITCFAVITMSQLSSMLHAQDSCQPVFDASTKVITTPSHSYSTHTMQGKTTNAEIIYAQGKAFARVNGKWMISPEGPKEVLEQEAENRKHATATCKIVREEPVNGQPATLYSLHIKTENSTDDGQMWIAKGSGLALREEIDIDLGEGNMGRSHVSIHYEYGNIKPPM